MAIRRLISAAGERFDLRVRTHAGRVRSQNEDAVAVLPVGPTGNVQAVIVADGMGGHRGGREASQLAIAEFERELARWDGPFSWSPLTRARICHAFESVNSIIRARATAEPGLAGMGTTVVLGLMSPELVVIAHVGDSPAFRLRGSELRRLTVDHTLRGQFEAKGRSPAALAGHSEADSLLRALGVRVNIEPSIYAEVPEPGDLYLLCSDGLTCDLTPAEIGSLLSVGLPTETIAETLIQEANRRGGHDNISVGLARYSRGAGIGIGRALGLRSPKEFPIQAVPDGVYDPTALPPVSVQKMAGRRETGRRRRSTGLVLASLGLLVLSGVGLMERRSLDSGAVGAEVGSAIAQVRPQTQDVGDLELFSLAPAPPREGGPPDLSSPLGAPPPSDPESGEGGRNVPELSHDNEVREFIDRMATFISYADCLSGGPDDEGRGSSLDSDDILKAASDLRTAALEGFNYADGGSSADPESMGLNVECSDWPAGGLVDELVFQLEENRRLTLRDWFPWDEWERLQDALRPSPPER